MAILCIVNQGKQRSPGAEEWIQSQSLTDSSLLKLPFVFVSQMTRAPPEPGANSNSHTEAHVFLSGGYQLDVIPEVGPVCAHVCAWGKVFSLPGPRRILVIADPSCRFFTLYLKLYQLICFSPEVSASWSPEVTTALTAGLTPLPKLRFSAPKNLVSPWICGQENRSYYTFKLLSSSEAHLTAYKTSQFLFLLNVWGSLHWFMW